MGIEVLLNYSLDIFKRANVKLDNSLLSVLLPSSCVLGYIISACIMSCIKRKYHFAFSAALMAISQAILGFALKLQVSTGCDSQIPTVFALFIKQRNGDLGATPCER